MRRLLFSLCLLLPMLSYANEIKLEQVVLLQADSVYQEKKVDVKQLANYIQNAQAVIEQELKADKIKPSSGFFVFAVKDNKKSTMWFDLKPALTQNQENKIANSVQKIAPFSVSNGIIVFAIQLSINGAKADVNAMPSPDAWTKAMKNNKGKEQEIEQLVNTIWE